MMAYALRSKGDPSPSAPEEHTDTPVSHLTESQTTTSTSNPFVPEELTQPLGLALLAYTADQLQLATEAEGSLT